MAVSAENKALAKYLQSIIKGTPAVTRYWDDEHHSNVDILSSRDVPTNGVTSYATLALSDHSIDLQLSGVPLRAELIMATATHFGCAPNILATCAFNVINTKMKCTPGQVYEGVVGMYHKNSDMKHILCVTPFLWNLRTQELASKTVAWLQAVPISDHELAFVKDKGDEALETVFEKRQIDVFNLDRVSVL